MSEPSKEALGLVRSALYGAMGYLGINYLTDEAVRAVTIRLMPLLDSHAAKAATSMLLAVQASLMEYPNGGGDIGVMKQVDRIAAKARLETLKQCRKQWIEGTQGHCQWLTERIAELKKQAKCPPTP